jgi:hypothetical protein
MTECLSNNDCPDAIAPNRALEPPAANALRLLAVPSSLRSSAAGQRERWASHAHGFLVHVNRRSTSWRKTK